MEVLMQEVELVESKVVVLPEPIQLYLVQEIVHLQQETESHLFLLSLQKADYRLNP
jgi:hypothetical protein